jgi:pimeloyl-ACP methyl ester carboxylesterase
MHHARLLSRLFTILFPFSIVLFAALNVSAQNCAPAPSGLVSWWTAEGSAKDSSGNTNNGTLQNGATFTTGKVGQAFSFNGNSQYVTVPDSPSLTQSQEITVEAWVRPAELPTGEWMSVVTKDNPGSGPYHLLVRRDGSVSWQVVTSAWVEINSGTDRISPGGFSHIAGSYNAATGAFCVYVNGKATCTQLSGSMRTNSNALKIGGDLYNSLFFKGEIDEVSIYNRALSTSEIQAIFNAGSAGKCNVTAPQQRPLIFIPGIMGSSLDSDLRSNVWPGAVDGLFIDHGILTLDPNKQHINVIPKDAIYSVSFPHLPSKIIYEPLLTYLKTTGGYHEYNVNGDPSRRTTAGCDYANQRGNNPNLFVFAYDWRLSNTDDNVAKLKDYIGCIQRFYPNTKVDILTHSMGGLLARRYILDNPNDHAVDKLITIAAPWLGAPKAINVMKTGEYDKDLNIIIIKSTLRSISEFFPSVHQLLPSRFYFALGGHPYVKNGTIFKDYDQFATAFDADFPHSNPVNTNAKPFHDNTGQDDWRTDQSGVKYYHIYGQKRAADTVGTVYSTTITSRGLSGAKTYEFFNTGTVRGDGTVPLLSAERRGIGPGLDLNAPGATLKLFANSNPAIDDLFDHTGLTQNLSVQNYILSVLTSTQQGQAASAEANEPTITPAYYLRSIGAPAVMVMDNFGNTTNPLADLSDGGIPSVTTFKMGDKAAMVITPTDQTYTVTLRSDNDPIVLEITKGTDIDTSQAVRYQDLSLPVGVTAMLKLTPEGVGSLQYDADGNGTFETTVTPTVSVNGTTAQDVTPPTVSVSETRQQSLTVVTLAASDNESGVKAIYYSTDGSNFQLYTNPFNVDPYRKPVIYTFADDNVANRSGLITFQLTAPASTLQFNAATYSVNEGDGRATITVTRAGDASGTATVDYATVDNPAAVRCDDTTTLPGVAFARCDYATTVDTLTFAPGETQKTFTVPIIDDGHVEGAETVQLRLSNVTGATPGAQSTATLTIIDNDSAAGANPIFQTDFFVRMQYLDFLSREPDAAGMAAWVATLNNCAPNDPTCDRVQVSANFFRSQEFQLKGLFVFKFYKVSFGRMPHYAEIVSDMRGVTGTTTPELLAKKAAFTSAWAQRQEFKSAYDSLSNAAFVGALMDRYGLQQITTPNPATPDDASQAAKVTLTRADMISRLDGGALSRAQVVRALADSNEVAAAEFNPAFVAMQYFGYLRRDPETQGYSDWLRTINANPTDFRSMVNGFVNSSEYQLRFGRTN